MLNKKKLTWISFCEENDITLTSEEETKKCPGENRLHKLKKMMKAKARQRQLKMSPSYSFMNQNVNIHDGRNTFQAILEDCEKTNPNEEEDTIHEATTKANANNINVYLRGDKHLRANNLNVDPTHKKCIMDGGADTTVIGQGWTVVAETNRKVNVIGFDKKSAIKKGLPMVTAVGAVDIDKDNTILIRVHEAVNNASSPHTLLSDFQVRECVDKLCVVWKGHGGEQITTIPLRMLECMMTFNV